MPIYKPPRPTVNQYGRVEVQLSPPTTFNHLIGIPLTEIIPFESGTDIDLEQGRIILPRYYFLFEGVKDNEIQFKPYEYDKHRIVVATYKGIITEILSIG